MPRNRISALIAALALVLAHSAQAASLTPPNLTAATTLNNADLLLVWPNASNGPLESIQWSTFKSLAAAGLGSAFLQPSNNLSDVASPTTARANLGLGSAALANTGTSGGAVPLLNGANTWSATQTHTAPILSAASTSSAAGLNLAPGTAPSSPNNGDIWTTSSGLFAEINGATQQVGGKTGFATLTLALSAPGTSSWTYTAQNGPWICNNGWVTLQIGIQATPIVGTGSGNLLVGGIPYNIANANGGYALEGGPVVQANGAGFTGLSGSMSFQGNGPSNFFITYAGPTTDNIVSSSNLSSGNGITLLGIVVFRSSTGTCQRIFGIPVIFLRFSALEGRLGPAACAETPSAPGCKRCKTSRPRPPNLYQAHSGSLGQET